MPGLEMLIHLWTWLVLAALSHWLKLLPGPVISWRCAQFSVWTVTFPHEACNAMPHNCLRSGLKDHTLVLARSKTLSIYKPFAYTSFGCIIFTVSKQHSRITFTMNYIFFTHDKFNDHFMKKAQPLLQKKKKKEKFSFWTKICLNKKDEV